MKQGFAIGFLAGALLALPVAWLKLRREPPGPGPTARDAPAPAADSGEELKQVRLRIAALEKDLAAVQAPAALQDRPRPVSPLESRRAQLLRLLQAGSGNDPDEATLTWRLTLWLYELADQQGLDREEAARSPEAFLALLTNLLGAWTPPLSSMEAAKFEDVKKEYLAGWADYLKNRDAMMGVERSVARDGMRIRLEIGVEGLLDDAHLRAYFDARSFWLCIANEHDDIRSSSVRDTSFRGITQTEAEFREGVTKDWTASLALRPEQVARLGPILDQYIRDVQAAEEKHLQEEAQKPDDAQELGWTEVDANGATIEDRVMITIQRRMALELGLDAEQLGRLRRWDSVIRVRFDE